MKYTIHGFSQKVAIEMNLKSDELLLLRWFVDFMGTNRMKKFFVEEECFYWVRYDSILEDLPILNCKKRTVADKFKNLVNANVLKNLTLKRGGTYSVYAIGTKYESLISDIEGCSSNNNGVAVQTAYKDLITINPSTNPSTKTHKEKNGCVCVEEIYNSEYEIFDYWNSKTGVVKNHEESFDQNKISTAVKKYGKENILKAIERLNDAVLAVNYYYEFRWNLYKFLKQSNGISNWFDDGQLWNDYSSRGKGENKKPAAKKNGFNSYEQRNYNYDDFERLERESAKGEIQ